MRLTTIWTLRGMRLAERLRRSREALTLGIAHRLPRRLAYWSFIDSGVRYMGNDVVPEVRYTSLLERFHRDVEADPVTRDAVPHGPTSPLSDDQPHPGTRGPSEPSGREVAAEGRAGGPTEGEIEAAARALETHNPPYDTTTAAEFRSGRAAAALAAALPLIEARLREQIAGEIEALGAEVPTDAAHPLRVVIDTTIRTTLDNAAARIARGRT